MIGWRAFGHAIAVVVLTALTQVGGVVYLLALLLRRAMSGRWRRSWPVLAALFVVLYASSWPVVERAAVAAGRVPLSCAGEGELRVALPHIFCAMHRHYVSPLLGSAVGALAAAMSERFPGAETLVLDANFPFLDGFPLLPHLSHDDGRKVDLAFYYAGQDGTYRPGEIRSPFGYWAFVPIGELSAFEFDACPDDAWPTLRWDMDWLQPLMRSDLRLDRDRNAALLQWIVDNGRAHGLDRVLVEPRVSLGLGFEDYGIIRFQGCRAARHDDHLHLQLR